MDIETHIQKVLAEALRLDIDEEDLESGYLMLRAVARIQKLENKLDLIYEISQRLVDEPEMSDLLSMIKEVAIHKKGSRYE